MHSRLRVRLPYMAGFFILLTVAMAVGELTYLSHILAGRCQ